MARIPESEIERLKQEVSLTRLVEAKGIALKRAGKDLIGRCCFHEDAEPSLVVTPAKNLWHCFGCQVGGGPIDWVMRAEGVSFRHACELLREGLPALAAGRERPVKHSTIRALPAPVTFDADDQALLDQVVGYYHDTLKASPEALAYLRSRGLEHPEAIGKFRLGFANRTLGLRLPDKRRKEGEQIRGRLEKLGLYRASGHEHFSGSLIIPVLDEAGHVTEVYGRKINDRLRPGTPLHLYLPGPHRGVWNVEALQSSKEIIVTEALIDALTFWCAGFRNVTSAFGVEGFTEDHLAAFKRHGIERVLIAYDRDEAGDRAAEKLAERFTTEGIECFRVQFPKGMDANDYALKVTPATRSLGLVIRKAQWMGKGQAPARAPEAVPAAVEVANCDIESPAPAAVAAEPVAECDRLADADGMPSVETVLSLAAEEEALPESSSALPASPVPPRLAAEIPVEVKAHEVELRFGERCYRVRGLQKNLSYELLKVNVTAESGERLYADTFDLRQGRARAGFVAAAARELQLEEPIVSQDVAKLFRTLERLQEEQIQKQLEPAPVEPLKMSEPERAAALALLKSPDLIGRIVEDLTAYGLVGERINKLVAYLAATSRRLDAPLAVLVQSSSAAGKSSLMDAVLALMPPEERIKYSAMTGQSLFYMGGQDLSHKILAIAEEEGAARAAYALKLLQSEGELSIASTAKDPATGNLITQDYQVQGPVMLFTTTTAADIDEELKNRCLVLAVDESREQTRAIHALQRDKRTLEGLRRKQARQALVTLHQNAQRLLRPLEVLNPFAAQLSFPDQATRTRRDHEKYLTLIDTIALVHQHQRKVHTDTQDAGSVEYVEVTLEDIALANELAHEVLGRSLDELPPQTRRLLLLIEEHVRAECERQSIDRSAYRFSRRSLREALGAGDTQLKIHLARLVELEYVVAHHKGPATEYELVYDGQGGDGKPFVPGLIDLEALRIATTTTNRSGVSADRSGSGRPLVGPRSGGGRAASSAVKPHATALAEESGVSGRKTHSSSDASHESSYPQPAVVPLAAAADRQ
jgi:DNA primase catalytic core